MRAAGKYLDVNLCNVQPPNVFTEINLASAAGSQKTTARDR
jgi:hypothetical protein